MRFIHKHAGKRCCSDRVRDPTGTRKKVLLAEHDGALRPVDVEIGIESGGQT